MIQSTTALQVPAQKISSIGATLPNRNAGNASSLRIQLGKVLTRAERFLETSSFLGAALAGGLHAVAGPDHYPALLPRCLGKRWYAAGKIGAVWGIGHSLSAMLIGLSAFMIKDRALLPGGFFSTISLGADVAIGLSMIFVGLISLQESKGNAPAPTEFDLKSDLLMNGVFHGLAIDGLPSMMPVLTADSFQNAAFFLFYYGLGGIGAMMTATLLIGHGTASLAQTTDFDLTHVIHGSAAAAVLAGVLWIAKAVLW